jgi:GntR family transcriptional regulator / MocR family aminotransferase
MVETWATTGIDLHLDRTGGKLRAGLEDALRDAVRTGRLQPGTRLPSSRSLATDIGIARNTVADAYGQLVAEGWLTARRGSSTRVADRAQALSSAASPAEAEASAPRYDLRAGSPDLSAFPRAAWLAAARRAFNGAAYGAMGYGDPRGRPELRHALAEYLSRARGVRTAPERIVICSGFAQGLRLLSEVLRARGAKTLAIEGFGQSEHRAAVLSAGLSLKNLALDAEGAQIGDIADADAALLTPAHQFPLGMVLAAGRRSEAVRWAQHSDAVVIEDDYDGEFAMTASRWGHSRRSRLNMSSMPEQPARAWRRESGSAGSCSPPTSWRTWSLPRRLRIASRARLTNSRWRSSLPAVAMTVMCAARGAPTHADANGW